MHRYIICRNIYLKIYIPWRITYGVKYIQRATEFVTIIFFGRGENIELYPQI